MRKRRSLRFVPWLLLLAAGVGLGLCCVRRGPDDSEHAEEPDTSAGAEFAAPSEMPQVDESDRIDSEDLKAAAEPIELDEEGEDGRGTTPVARYLQNSNQHDRQLLASIERETQKAPSPEVMELLAQRRAGASREQLERFIDSELGSDLRVRVAAKRWLRQSLGEPAPAPSPLPGDTKGSTPKTVQPLKP